MLQQTQVATVIDYFNRFVKQLPTVADLASAKESKVLSLWEGLGYYRRAKNMQRAAKVICTDHNGEFPLDYEDVLALPGIGRYTAGAILSIAASQPHPILEGNTYRLHARLLGLRKEPREKQSEQLLWSFAESILPTGRSKQDPGDLNQALMEIGSEICKPRNPDCANCPLKNLCCAHQLGLENELPVARVQPKYQALHQALIIIEDQRGRMLVRQREADEWWSGLWDFLRIDLTQVNPSEKPQREKTQRILREIRSLTGCDVRLDKKPNQTLQHGVTKYRITLDCYHILLDAAEPQSTSYSFRSKRSLKKLPLNVTAREFFNHVFESAD